MARCKNKYTLPLNKKDISHWHKKSSPAHKGSLKHSLDFFVENGCRIYAAQNGVVTWTKDNSNKHGTGKKYTNLGNRIVIKHKNDEYSAYEHLKCKGVFVRKGQKVKKGQFIGLTGMTGWINQPHLHFEVFNNLSSNKSEGETLQVFFKIKRKGRCNPNCYR